MKSDYMPSIRLEIRPLVLNIVQSMGIENSVLAEKISEAVDYEIKKQILDIPRMAKDEVSRLLKDEIRRECDAYAELWMSPEWCRKNKGMVNNFENTIRSEVMIAIGEHIKKNGKIIK